MACQPGRQVFMENAVVRGWNQVVTSLLLTVQAVKSQVYLDAQCTGLVWRILAACSCRACRCLGCQFSTFSWVRMIGSGSDEVCHGAAEVTPCFVMCSGLLWPMRLTSCPGRACSGVEARVMDKGSVTGFSTGANLVCSHGP